MHRHMAMVAVALSLGVGGAAFGQLGLSEAECLRQFGSPTRAALSNGVRVLNFSITNGVLVRADLVEDVVHRVAYAQEGLAGEAVQQLLQLNAGPSNWTLFRHTDLPGGLGQDVWIRADEGAMGVYEADTLILNTGYWNQWVSKQAEAVPGGSQAEVASSPPTEPADPMSPLVGCWQAETRGGMSAFTCSPEGALAWVAMTDAEQREFRGRAVSLGPEKPLRFEVWRLARDREPLGLAVIEDDGALHIRRRQGPDLVPTGFWPIDKGEDLTYKRVAAMPEWKATGPDEMPTLGASRAEVLDLCGKPRGSMTAGGQEVLSYPWGQVIFESGRVVRLKTKPARP